MIIVLYLSLLWNLCGNSYIWAHDLLMSGSAIRNTLFGPENLNKCLKLELCQEKQRLLNALASIKIENDENAEDLMDFFLIEGVVCKNTFKPLAVPVKMTTQSHTTKLDCLNRYRSLDHYSETNEIVQGIIVHTNHKNVMFPLLWTRIDSEAVLEWITKNHRKQIKGLKLIVTPLAVCTATVKFIRLPYFNFTGYAPLFYATAPDSRDCGFLSGNGHAAAVLFPAHYDYNKKPGHIIKLLIGPNSFLSLEAANPIFFAHALHFHNIRAAIISVDLLIKRQQSRTTINQKTSETAYAYTKNFLKAMLDSGIPVIVAISNKHTCVFTEYPRLLLINGMKLLTAPGIPLPSIEYKSLVETISESYFVSSLKHQTSVWSYLVFANNTRTSDFSLISGIVDGTKECNGRNSEYYPLRFLISNWMNIINTNPQYQRRTILSPLHEKEILIFTVDSSEGVKCNECVILNATRGIQPKYLEYIF
ncbi:uncharacterized protein LOC128883540 [Hylaeus volcanicus]|uniref:uncharacterized protein LOC128883540 n=1 Tax=Hylaeus volcanicus TaxID=313075 RepID=UPI0023B7C5C6|nr:uncharacterized protein LOC128883540 [Hylaeus volcanicus]